MRRFLKFLRRELAEQRDSFREVGRKIFPDYHPRKKQEEKEITRREALLRMLRSPPVRTAIETPFVRLGAKLAHTMVNEHVIGKERYHDAAARSVMNPRNKSLAGRWALAAFTMTYAPVMEEMLFRIVPNEALERFFPQLHGQNIWKVGIPLSVLFAAIHNYNYPPGYRDRVIPVKQFLEGCYFWYLIRQRGRRHAIAAHSESNLFEFIAGKGWEGK